MTIQSIRRLLDFTQVLRILKVVWHCSRGLTITRLALTILQAILPLIPLYLMKLLLDAFVGDPKPVFNDVLWILLGFVMVQILLIIVSNLMTYVSTLQSVVVSDYMSEVVIKKAIQTDLEFFDDDSYHDLYHRAIVQSAIRPIQVLTSLTQLVQSAISLTAIFFLLITLHWVVSFILLIIALPIALIRLHFANKLVSLKVKQTQIERKAFYLKNVLTGAQDAKEVRIFGFGAKLLERFLAIRKSVRDEKKELDFNQSKSVGLAQSVEAIAIIAALGLIIWRALKDLISVGDIAMYFGAFQKGQTSINSALKSLVQLHENKKYLKHLFAFLDIENNVQNSNTPIDVPQTIEEISLTNVSFTYPKTTKKILNDISLNIKKGQLLAIVGQNGSGKSTLVKLLSRFYDVDEGSIMYNGIDITSFKQEELRKKITVLFQSFSKYNMSVQDNIQLANLQDILDNSKLEEASIKGLSQPIIEKFEKGYKTQLGRSFRQGEELSGGQWQKMALSRAFYKDSDVIILDEPTSFIDPLAEDEIFFNIKEKAKDKIIILITHRMYNLKHADKIIVLEQGQIIEQGNHETLMNQKGLYKSMFEKQE